MVHSAFIGGILLIKKMQKYLIQIRIKVKLNEKEFIIRIVNTKDSMKSGYVCESDEDAVIYSTPSEVINENYKIFFDKSTCYSGPCVLGFDDEIFVEQSRVGVLFFPFEIVTNSITIFVARRIEFFPISQVQGKHF